MITVASIQNGLVIDHIPAGKGLKIFYHLGLDSANLQTALIMNVPSNKMGSKDMIKIENSDDVNLDDLGILAPQATVSVIRRGKTVKKFSLTLPERVVNLLFCKNPRCVTTVEQQVDHVFVRLPGSSSYRCKYCDHLLAV
ncbi:MAG: aspartate carbamoyltransferase regulatory subunit [Negativicutes bacterium]|nr:aspartate carbamoyltransferase regulatory subunit [Negativicutes bacterium]